MERGKRREWEWREENGEWREERMNPFLLHSPFAIPHSPILHSSFPIRHSPFAIPHSPFTMKIIVVYDIANNKIRTKVADICEDYGLDRVQYSAFAGDLARVHQEEMMEKIGHRLGKLPGKIYLYPICEKDWQHRIEIQREKKADADATRE